MQMTLVNILETAVRATPNKVAFAIHGDGEITYKELYEASRTFASNLKEISSKHVGILLPNSIDWVISLFGVAFAGKVAVLLNTRLTPSELVYQLYQSDAGVLITDSLHGKDT